MSIKGKNNIIGLPSSYDANYMFKTNKKCFICQSNLTQDDLEKNNIICTENFEFSHLKCVNSNNYEIVFHKKNDTTSMVKLIKKIKESIYESPTI